MSDLEIIEALKWNLAVIQNLEKATMPDYAKQRLLKDFRNNVNALLGNK